MSRQRYSNEPPSGERRRALEQDIQAFLDSGKTIEQVPSGISGQDGQGRSRKHIVLGNKKRR